MVRTKLLLSIFLAVALAPFALAQTAPHHKSHKAKPVKPLVLPPLPPGPLPQVPLDQLPAVAPQVSYQNGSLTIVAENSTLGDILREVRKRTGASIDVPGNATERVATRLGPGPARDILTTLLNGTSFNYVMVGSAGDPTALASVVLTPRPAGGAVQTAQAQQPAPVYTAPDFGPGTGRPGFVPPQPGPMATAESGDDKDDDDSADDSDQDQQAEGQAGQPGTPAPQVPGVQFPQNQAPDGTDSNGNAQPNVGPRTPQQILQMLQQQRQQQQQQQPQNQDTPPQQ